MSVRTVHYLTCDYCDRRPVRVDNQTPWPTDWLYPCLPGDKHTCPECLDAGKVKLTILPMRVLPLSPTSLERYGWNSSPKSNS